MRHLLLNAVRILLIFALVGLHARKSRHVRSPLSSRGHASAGADTRNRIVAARIKASNTPPANPNTTPSNPSTTNKPSPYEPTYTYDEHGRVVKMEVRLKAGEYDRGSTDTSKVRGIDGIPPGYADKQDQNRGHILGAVLGGTNHTDLNPRTADPNEYYNFIPENSRVNTPMKNGVEMDIDNAVQQHGKEVDYTVSYTYPPGSTDPTPSTVGLNASLTNPAGENPPFVIDYTWPNDGSIRDKHPDGSPVYPKHDKISFKW